MIFELGDKARIGDSYGIIVEIAIVELVKNTPYQTIKYTMLTNDDERKSFIENNIMIEAML